MKREKSFVLQSLVVKKLNHRNNKKRIQLNSYDTKYQVILYVGVMIACIILTYRRYTSSTSYDIFFYNNKNRLISYQLSFLVMARDFVENLCTVFSINFPQHSVFIILPFTMTGAIQA